ncbi:MAG: hypothetical protein R6U26_01735 [Candidatus Undinarchaeales archaeon]
MKIEENFRKAYISSVHKILRLEDIIKIIEVVNSELKKLRRLTKSTSEKTPRESGVSGHLLISSKEKGKNTVKKKLFNKYKTKFEEWYEFLSKKIRHFDLFLETIYLSGIYDVFEYIAEELDEEIDEANSIFLEYYNQIIEKYEPRKSSANGAFAFFGEETKSKLKSLKDAKKLNVENEKELILAFHKSAENYIENYKPLKKIIKKSKNKDLEIDFDLLIEETRKAYFTGVTDGIKSVWALENIKDKYPAHSVAFSLEDDRVEGYNSLFDKEHEVNEKFEASEIRELSRNLKRWYGTASKDHKELKIDWPKKRKLI